MVVYQSNFTNKRSRGFRVRSLSRFAERRVQSQKLPNHEDTYPEPGKIKVSEEKPRETQEEWVISIKDKVDKACGDVPASSWDKLCIYRVPHYLQEDDKKSYFPQTVSLGPYHHGKEHLLPMECHKLRAVHMVLEYTKKDIETYIDAMKNLEETARACYQGPICMSSNEFTEMLFLDGCFVLELFRGTKEGFTEIGYAPTDPVFAMGRLMISIQRDMVMLENQIPLFVLDKLLELQPDTVYQPGLVAQLAVNFFAQLMPTGEELTKRDKVESVDSVSDNGELHCLDVFHRSLFKSTWTPDKKSLKKSISSRKQQLIHCVTELKEAGVKFRRKKTDKLWDIEFRNGYLKIPKLLIHDSTKSLFSNLIAFEQCHANSSNDITSYIIFMDNLINSAEDIREKLEAENQGQGSEPINPDQNLPSLPEVTRSDQDQEQSNHNHDQTLSEASKIEVTKGSPKEPRDDWVISITDKLEQAHRDDDTTIWGKLCIYRVPYYLQENDNKSYFPQTVSLGPYHHGKKRLRPMDRHKWRAVNKILKRTNQNIKMYIDAMRELEEKARACYEGPFGLSSNEFIEMLVLDGCFVLELFRGAVEGFTELGYARNDPVFAMRGSMHSIQRDMIMLENQLPLFVLNRLLELQLGTRNQTGLVAQLAVRFFDPLMPTDEPMTKTDQSKLENYLARDKAFDPFADMGELHCLDVFRRSLLRSSPKPEPRLSRKRWSSRNTRVADKRRQQLIHCVTELREAGIKFRRRKTDRFWDIQFNNGYLEIPRLLIHDGTKSLFLNLIAFEQCHIDSRNDITSYIIFMDNLIDSHEDVSYLHYCGIIEHWLGSDSEVANLFNRLCEEVVFDTEDSYLSRLSVEVNRYYNQKWNAWRATLRHKYFNNPWAIVSFCAAVILLVLTLSQSFYAAYAYYKPPS
ncbi:hypothetical protein HID58_035081 [Brassica napus]|uniref:Uncharacterized protein n=1 Tax=Brassica napus TaxID=3708 RepID=A0ABQ8C3Y2_BRANA|nr:hypothetical protein HID58_035081 [Brassica napus]